MELKRPDSPEATVERRGLLVRQVQLSRRALLCVLLVAMAGGIVAQRSGLLGRIKRLFGHDLSVVAVNYVKSLGADVEHLTIDIKHENYEKLSEWRNEALAQWQITSNLKEYVPARITHGDVTRRVHVRLKGEWGDHVDTDKWSLRIKVRDGETLMGMKRFSIQHPKTRDFIHEWVHHAAMRREDVLTLRYDFVDVTINGRHLGIYALEEHFTKQLVEHNQRREGVIVKFNADYRYKPVSDRSGSLWHTARTGMDSQHSSEVKVYDEARVAADPKLSGYLAIARELLEGLRAGELRTGEAFDLDRLAAYMALSDLLGTRETAADWSDMRFYYDPLASRLEPISVEGAQYERIVSLIGVDSRDRDPKDFHAILFEDDEFWNRYVAALERVSRPEYLNAFLTEIGPQLEAKLAIVHSEWPQQVFRRAMLSDNAAQIRAFLGPEKGLHAFVAAETPGRILLELGATQVMPLEVLRVTHGERVFEPTSNGGAEHPVLLEGLRRGSSVLYRTVEMLATNDGDLHAPGDVAPEVLVHFRLLGGSEVKTVSAFEHVRRHTLDGISALAPDASGAQGSLSDIAFIEVDEEARRIDILAGEWHVSRDLIFPAGHVVHAGPGVSLELGPGVKIVSRSPLDWRGDEEDPIVIHAAGSEGGGQGIFVIDAGATSTLSDVVFRSLSAPTAEGWGLTGAVTFYRSPVDILDCEFRENQAEDALNVIRADFALEASLFRDCPSDAIDADFTRGRIAGCSFVGVGGDAVDVSGSEITLEDLFIDEVADKGLSVGENSNLSGKAIRIRGTRIGVASKDLSRVELTDLALEDTRIGLSAYRKKGEYGPGQIFVKGLTTERTSTVYLVEEGSRITIDGEVMSVNSTDLVLWLYPEEAE